MIIGMCIISLYINKNIDNATLLFGLLCVVVTVFVMAVGAVKKIEENNSDELKNE